jgi:hypothetical protein
MKMKMIMRIATVDMDGYNGREHHPTKEMEGRFVRITNMDTVPDFLELEEMCDECAAPAGHTHETSCSKGQWFVVLHGILVDANGEDVEGGEVELIEHEIVTQNDMPMLYNDCLA